MSILREIELALHDEVMKLATAPRDTRFLIVLNSEARNEFFKELLRQPQMMSPGQSLSNVKFHGNMIAVLDDDGAQRIEIFTKAKR